MRHWPFSNNYQDWIDAIDGRDDFKAYTKTVEHNPCSTSEYIVFNYVSIMAEFQNPDQLDISDKERLYRSLRYSMRGAIFDAATKKLIRLPLHKFHNLNEKEQNQFANLDWSEYEVFDKMDGSMIAPFRVHGWNDIFWGSKMGITHLTKDVENFVARDTSYDRFFTHLEMNYNATPIFEYVGNPLHRIVINYDQESLVLLAVRYMDDGTYMGREYMEELAESFNIPLVKKWDVDFNHDASGLIERIQDLKGEEGVVIRFPNDQRVKVKASDYVTLHKTRSAVETERFVASCIMNETVDDLLPLVPDHVKTNLIKYAENFLGLFEEKAVQYFEELVLGFARAGESRKDFALDPLISNYAKRIGFKMLDGKVANTEEGLRKELNAIVCGLCESTETKFAAEIRENMFDGRLMAWNIWTGRIDD